MRLTRFVHFNVNWLDFVFVGRKFRKNFLYARKNQKNELDFMKMCIFALKRKRL